MNDYLVLVTDRKWKSEWQPLQTADPVQTGSRITIRGDTWEVLNEWVDKDGVHLVFCVRHPKEDQLAPPGIAP